MLNLTPLLRSTIGFDPLFEMIDDLSRWDRPAALPYNIEKTGEDSYRFTLVAVGFAPDELTVETVENELVVRGRKQNQQDRQWLYRGLDVDSFEQRIPLAGYMRVTGAHMANGLLHIELVRELPEAMRPHRIPITSGDGGGLVTKARKLLGRAA